MSLFSEVCEYLVCIFIDIYVYLGVRTRYAISTLSILWFKVHLKLAGSAANKTQPSATILYAKHKGTKQQITPHIRYFYRTLHINQQVCWRLDLILKHLGLPIGNTPGQSEIELIYYRDDVLMKSIIDLKRECELTSGQILDFGSIDIASLPGRALS